MINPDNLLKNGLNNLLKDNAPIELFQLISSCSSYDDLVQKLENDPSRLFAVFQNLKLEGNDPFAVESSRLAARLLIRLDSSDLAKPEVKKVETILRNRRMLDRSLEPDMITLTNEVESSRQRVESLILAHKAILALESPYFRTMKGFKDFEQSKLVINNKDLEISPETYQIVIDYLYLTDKERETFLSTVDKSLLIHIAKLADYWLIDGLKERCDEELCNSLGKFNIEKEDIDEWKEQAILFPKFVQLLGFINRVAGNEQPDLCYLDPRSYFEVLLRFITNKVDLEPFIEEMHTPEGAARLATKCTPEEIQAFATLKTAFGQICRQPPGTFGKAEWEKTYPITIVGDVPPLPPNIHAILELEDPCEPGKKLKDTCKLFLRPEKVILHEESGDKELILGFDGMEELAMKAMNPERRTRYDTYNTFHFVKNRMNRMPVEASAWVLMRKELIPKTKGYHFEEQKLQLKGSFEVPKVMDAILLNMITYAEEGMFLYEGTFPYGQFPWTFTLCQVLDRGVMMVVGYCMPKELYVSQDQYRYIHSGIAGVWKF